MPKRELFRVYVYSQLGISPQCAVSRRKRAQAEWQHAYRQQHTSRQQAPPQRRHSQRQEKGGVVPGLGMGQRWWQ